MAGARVKAISSRTAATTRSVNRRCSQRKSPLTLTRARSRPPNQDRTVDRCQWEALAGDGADQQHRRWAGHEGKSMPPEDLGGDGDGDDETGLLEKKDLPGRIGKVQDADDSADDQNSRNSNGEPLQTEEEQFP